MKYHQPVLLNETVNGLDINPDGIYVDVTFGGGGHSKAILQKLENGLLFAFDQDEDALSNSIDDKRFVLINNNFRYLKKSLRLHAISKVDGVLADLGVSSHQFDAADRGFSAREEGVLDMRMNQSQSLCAKQVVNEYEVEDLARLLRKYGELKNAYPMALAIERFRDDQKIETTINEFIGKDFSSLKTKLSEKLVETISPIGKNIEKLMRDRKHLEDVLKKGKQKANIIAEENLKKIREIVGFV